MLYHKETVHQGYILIIVFTNSFLETDGKVRGKRFNSTMRYLRKLQTSVLMRMCESQYLFFNLYLTEDSKKMSNFLKWVSLNGNFILNTNTCRVTRP